MRIENPGAVVFDDEEEIRALRIMAEFAVYYADVHSIARVPEEYRLATLALARKLLSLRFYWRGDDGEFRG